jgi:hypothetical protein
MNARGITPGLAATLRSLAVGQLQMQASRSATLDTVAIGVMGIDLAGAALVVGAQSAHHLWIASLAVLGLSFGLAMRALFLAGAVKIGPSIENLLEAHCAKDGSAIEQQIVRNLAVDLFANRQALADKGSPLMRALGLVALAIVTELVGLVA